MSARFCASRKLSIALFATAAMILTAASPAEAANSAPVVLVHGFAGFGRDEARPTSATSRRCRASVFPAFTRNGTAITRSIYRNRVKDSSIWTSPVAREDLSLYSLSPDGAAEENSWVDTWSNVYYSRPGGRRTRS